MTLHCLTCCKCCPTSSNLSFEIQLSYCLSIIDWFIHWNLIRFLKIEWIADLKYIQLIYYLYCFHLLKGRSCTMCRIEAGMSFMYKELTLLEVLLKTMELPSRNIFKLFINYHCQQYCIHYLLWWILDNFLSIAHWNLLL